MENNYLGEGMVKKELNLLFVIDNSGSMHGEKIGAVNNAIRDVITILPDVQNDTADVEIKLSAITFADDAKFVYSEPKRISEFKWKDVTAYGGTNLSDAYDKMTNFLSKKSNGGQMPDFGGIAPIVLLMTDGYPTSLDWEEKLSILKKKGWYKVALKYALAIKMNDSTSQHVLEEFTGNPETVLKICNAEALRQIIKIIAVTSSKVKSSLTTTTYGNNSTKNANQQAVQAITEKIEDTKGVDW